MVFQCKNYSEITVETRTQLKSVIFTTDIFAVHKIIRIVVLLELRVLFEERSFRGKTAYF